MRVLTSEMDAGAHLSGFLLVSFRSGCLGDSTAHIVQGKSSPLSNPLEKLSQTHSQVCFNNVLVTN